MGVRRGLIVLFCSGALACGNSADPGGSAGSGGTGASAGSGGDAGAAGNASAGAGGNGGSSGSGCGSPAPSTGTRTLSFGGAERSYILHLPPNYDSATPTPVVLNFHGRTASSFGVASTLHEGLSGMNAKADSAGFIVITPQGITDPDSSQTWNAGVCCAADKSRDDVGFVDAILDEAGAELCVDTKRVFATGLSNGGFLSHRLACERADRIAAVAPVAALNGMTTCQPSRPISVIAFNGTADALVSHATASQHMQAWASRNGCDGTPTETFQNGDSRCDTYADCDAGTEVVFCTVEDGGHTWPGGADLSAFGFGKTTYDLIANDAMWDFFMKHPLP